MKQKFKKRYGIFRVKDGKVEGLCCLSIFEHGFCGGGVNLISKRKILHYFNRKLTTPLSDNEFILRLTRKELPYGIQIDWTSNRGCGYKSFLINCGDRVENIVEIRKQNDATVT